MNKNNKILTIIIISIVALTTIGITIYFTFKNNSTTNTSIKDDIVVESPKKPSKLVPKIEPEINNVSSIKEIEVNNELKPEFSVNKHPYQYFGFFELVNEELSNYESLIERDELGNIIKETYFKHMKYDDLALCKQINYIKHFKNNKLILQQVFKVFDETDEKNGNKLYRDFFYNENDKLVKIVQYKKDGNIDDYILLEPNGYYQEYDANNTKLKGFEYLPSTIREIFHIQTQL